MDKNTLRTKLRKLRNELPDVKITELSQKITEQIIHTDWFICANTVMLYRSAKNEVMTDYLWDACMKAGKTCLFPKCVSKTEMIAVQIEKKDDFSLSHYQIPEPISDVEFPKSEIDLILVPGLGFDKTKNRIGYGAGYYDRYLSDFSGITCGLCFQLQLCESVFPDTYDIPLTYIATESEIL